MYITNIYLYTYYSYFIYNNIYNNLPTIYIQRSAQYRVLKDVKFTYARRGHSGDTNPSNTGVHTCESHPTISQHFSDVTLPSLCFRNILRSDENVHILFTSSNFCYWFVSFLIIFERFIIFIQDENDFDMGLWAIIHNMLLIKVHLDMIII